MREEFYLGIDQSLNATGIALVDASGLYVASQTITCIVGLGSAARLYRIRTQFCEFLSIHVETYDDIRGVAREGFAVEATNRPFDLGMVAGVLEEATYAICGLNPLSVPPTSLKKFATGSGAASKTQMLDSVKKKLGVDLGERDDEADAVFLALFARAYAIKKFDTRAAAEAVHALSPATKRTRLKRASNKHNV